VALAANGEGDDFPEKFDRRRKRSGNDDDDDDGGGITDEVKAVGSNNTKRQPTYGYYCLYQVWGTCLGFEWLLMAIGGEDFKLDGNLDAENISLPLELTENAFKVRRKRRD